MTSVSVQGTSLAPGSTLSVCTFPVRREKRGDDRGQAGRSTRENMGDSCSGSSGHVHKRGRDGEKNVFLGRRGKIGERRAGWFVKRDALCEGSRGNSLGDFIG